MWHMECGVIPQNTVDDSLYCWYHCCVEQKVTNAIGYHLNNQTYFDDWFFLKSAYWNDIDHNNMSENFKSRIRAPSSGAYVLW